MNDTRLEHIMIDIRGFRGDSEDVDKLCFFTGTFDTSDDKKFGAEINHALHNLKANFVTIEVVRRQ